MDLQVPGSTEVVTDDPNPLNKDGYFDRYKERKGEAPIPIVGDPEKSEDLARLREVMQEAEESERFFELRELVDEERKLQVFRYSDCAEQSRFFEREMCFGCSLTYAVKLGHVRVTKWLLEYQADANSRYKLQGRGADGKLLDKFVTLPVIAAAISENRDEKIFELLHEKKAAIDCDFDESKAAIPSDTKVKIELVPHSSDFKDIKDLSNWNLLYEASYHGCLPVIKYLRKHTSNFKEVLKLKVGSRHGKTNRNPADRITRIDSRVGAWEKSARKGKAIDEDDPDDFPFSLLYDLANPPFQKLVHDARTPSFGTQADGGTTPPPRTPLQCAIWRGHRPIVAALLQMGSQQILTESVKVDIPYPMEPQLWVGTMPVGFATAINNGDLKMITLLVKEFVNVFEGTPPRDRFVLGYRCIDYVFGTDNPLIIGAVVAGLCARSKSSQNSANIFSKMTINDLLRIMMIANCDAIFDAIFHEKLQVEDMDEKEKDKDEKETEKISRIDYHDDIGLRICEGRSSDGLAKLALDAGDPDIDRWTNEHDLRGFRQFIARLLPDAAARHAGVAPISIRQCVVANVHSHPLVAYVLAHPPNDAIFEYPGAQAIIKYKWKDHEHWYFLDFVCNFLMAGLFLCFAFIINQGSKAQTRYMLGSCALLLWLRSVAIEILQLIGDNMLNGMADSLRPPPPGPGGICKRILECICPCCAKGKKKRGKETGAAAAAAQLEGGVLGIFAYFGEIANWIDMARLGLTGFGIYGIFNAESLEIQDHMGLRIQMGCVMFLLWTKVLYSQRGFKFIGPTMFPIQAAVSATWPFLFMMFWPAVGFAQGYYMLGVYPEYFRAATLVYRAGFLGDIDIEEIEDIDPSFSPSEDNEGFLEVEDPEWTEYHVVFVAFTVVVSLGFTVIMMNILIGVLSEAYMAAFKERDRLFLQSRASIVFEASAVSRAIEWVSCQRRRRRPCCQCRRTPQEFVSRMSTISDGWLDKMSEEDIKAMYIREAIQGIGTDQDELIRIICPMDISERTAVKAAYMKMFGENMTDKIKEDTSGKFQKALETMLEAEGAVGINCNIEEDCQAIHKAMAGKADDWEKCVELICTKNKEEMNALKKKFKEKYDRTLEDFIRAETASKFHIPHLKTALEEFQAAMLLFMNPPTATLGRKATEAMERKTKDHLASIRDRDGEKIGIKKYLWYCQSTVVRQKSVD